MDKKEIISSISSRGNGEIYLGVVGAVRSGKSTFIKKVIENLVVPNIEDEYERKRCLDEIPQTANGKQIMTIEPKFVPSAGAKIKIEEIETNIKLIDCVGFVTPEASGFLDENGNERMVKTPWFSEDLPFKEAAEIGTEKVIKDHSTIGIVVTTDGSILDMGRNNYVDAEEKVINELKEINKPFIVIMNTTHPNDETTKMLCKELEEKYNVVVIPQSIIDMNERDIINILKEALYEFPIKDIEIKIPDWIGVLPNNNEIKKAYLSAIKDCTNVVDKLRDVEKINLDFEKNEYISNAYISNLDTNNLEVTITLDESDDLYDKVLKDTIGVSVNSRAELLKVFMDFREGKSEYELVKDALAQAYQTGYGVVMPTVNDMKLEKPQIIKQSGRYGVKLKALASSIHMIKVDVESSFEPIIGTEMQSKELIDNLMKDKDKDESSIWKSEIFGRSLEVIVSEGIQAKINMVPENVRYKLGETIKKIVNKGSGNLIAIVI